MNTPAGLGVNGMYNAYEEYIAQLRQKYSGQINQGLAGNYGTNTIPYDTPVMATEGIGDNKLTDGKDDGKIGFFSALGNAAEGIVKGAVNGIAGCLGIEKDENGISFNPKKLLGTAALVGASILCPPIAVGACAIGAVSGAAQLVNGFKRVAEVQAMVKENGGEMANADAMIKQAWENIGEGTSTVVGSVIGAKGANGAIKASASSSIDDVAKVMDDVDDVAKILGKIDDTDDVARMLKKKGVSNADEVAKTMKKEGVSNAEDMTKILKEQGKTTSFDTAKAKVNADDLHGMDKIKTLTKGYADDVINSTKKNVSTAKKYKQQFDYKNQLKKQDELNNTIKKLEAADGDNAKQIESLKKQLDKIDTKMKTTKASIGDEAVKNIDTDVASKKYESSLDNSKAKFKTRSEAKAKIDKLTKEGKKGTAEYDEAVKAWKKADVDFKEAQNMAKTNKNNLENLDADALQQTKSQYKENLHKDNSFKGKFQQAKTKLNDVLNENSSVKAKFGEIKKQIDTSAQGKKMEVLKIIRENMDSDMLKAVGDDGMKIVNFLQNKSMPEAIKEFGYENVMQTIQTVYGLSMANNSI